MLKVSGRTRRIINTLSGRRDKHASRNIRSGKLTVGEIVEKNHVKDMASIQQRM
jgi:hypothetical protein